MPVDKGYGSALARRFSPTIAILIMAVTFPSVVSFFSVEFFGNSVAPGKFHALGIFYAILWMGIIISCFSGHWLKPLLSVAPLRFVGKISFSMYLFHTIIIGEMRQVEIIPVEFKGIAILMLTVGVSAVTYYLIEERGIKIGKRFSRCLSQRKRTIDEAREKNAC